MRLGVTLVDPTRSGAPVDVEVIAAPGTPLGSLRTDLLKAVGRTDGTLFADGRALNDDDAWGEPPLLNGALLTVDRPEQREPPGPLELHVVAGPDSGTVHHLTPGEHSIGRAAEAAIRVDDPDVSRLHAVIRVGHLDGGSTVRDLGSTNGTTADGHAVGLDAQPLAPGQVLRIGETRMTLVVPQPVPVSCRADGLGRLEVNRPPRHMRPPDPVSVTLPTEPTPREHGRFPWLAILLPMLAGVVLVAVTRSPTYLLFLLLSPLMAAGTFLSDRVGGRRSARAQRIAYDEECARARDTVARAVAEETAELLRAHPDLATLAVTAAGPRPRLWQRRPADHDALELRLGLGTVPSTVTVRTPGALGRAEDVERPDLADAPVTVSLVAAGVLGVAGDRRRALPLARSLVAQLAGWHSPRHLSLVLLSTEPVDWEWVRWLPHLRSEDGPLRVGLDRMQVRSRVDELLALIDARIEQQARAFDRAWTGPTTVVILDGAGTLRREPGVARLLDEGPAVGLRVVAVDRDLVSLPVECRATAEITGPVGTRLRVVGPDGSTYDDVVADGVSDRWAHRFARALAPLRDATPDDREDSLPDTVRLLDLLPFDATDPAALETAWLVSPRSTTVPLGVGSDGEPVLLDFAADGPHALVAGTTGSGKSELLQTLVAGLAVANRPDEMSFVLIDYKGGAAFKDCARLPHTVGMVTDLDGHLTERALRSLGAELRRREELLRIAGCKDLDDYLAAAAAGSPSIPRLVLVVDEFATLAEELPDFVGGLVGIAQRGRSLGVHLVLATQRPGGAVSADIRANTGLRIALRVTDPAESTDVVDVPDAAGIGRAHPGRAVMRVGAGLVRIVQTARVGGHAASATRPLVRAVPWERAGEPVPRLDAAPPTGPSDLARLVDSARRAADRLGTGPAPSPWLPPLPDIVTVDELAGLAELTLPESVVVYGVADLPDEQRRAAVSFAVDGGDHLLVAGSARSGRSTMLRTLAAGLSERWDVADLHLFALDGGGGALAPLAELPHCGAVVGRDEPARGDRLLRRLVDEVEARQRLLATAGYGSVEEQRAGTTGADRLPWLVLLADGWEGLAAAFEAVDHGRPLDTLLRLVREGAAAGLRVVLTGDRTTLSGRAAAAFRERVVLRLADRADYGLAGIPPRQVPGDLPAGRALVGPGGVEAQLAVLDPDTSGAGQLRALHAVATRARAQAAAMDVSPRLLPLRVEPLPSRVDVGDIEAAAKALEPAPSWALVGVGGDELLPVGIDLDLDGPAFVIAGPPGSGRSTALGTMGRWALGRGRPVVIVAHRRSPLRALEHEAGVVGTVGSGEVADLEQALSRHPEALVLADDAETLHDTAVERPLLALLRADAESAASLVLAGSAQEMAGMFRGLTVEARRTRTGLLLGALSPVDGDLLGVRLPHCDAAPPGRAVLVVRGRPAPVQVARSPL